MIKLKSVYQEYIWGGSKIHELLHKDTGTLPRVAESWEVSTHPAGKSIVENGAFRGKTLNEYFDQIGWGTAGRYAARNHQLPILIKYIDAKENLSIQVHPNDKYARKHEGDNGKNEMWFVLAADEGAFIYLGFSRDVTKEEIKRRIADNTLEEVLNRVEVKPNEAFYIPAGTVHAIGAGCLICEVQQTSNVTYRIYDYGRTDENGKPRELHVKKALDVLDYRRTEIADLKRRDTMSMERYIDGMFGRNGKCTLLKYEAEGDLTILLPVSHLTFALVIDGSGKLYAGDSEEAFERGDTWMIHGRATRVSGKCKVLFVAI
ncbi:MAG TPA: class I mannose-6-phosphate isomerase [Candidatus Gallimonas intestinavium]|uniref:Class I mannose-6-phosphate isomerase n=1 Tax=Candidatus Gallimonas intestinavium TaxID=2838603 RepID=A0A9D2G5M5_9FIRM|nr:class I mannose-6-phosphate isomerase [Candidatus Gallimonas intestinavium]